MNIFNQINLPIASKHLISLILKKRGKFEDVSGTNSYVARLKGKEYIFLGEFTPLTPYMYGIVFSNQRYWFEILKELKMKFAWDPGKTQKKLTILMTGDGFYNAVWEKGTVIVGDGKTSLKNLIKKENIRRINLSQRHIMPIMVEERKTKLQGVPKNGEKVEIKGSYDYEDASQNLDKNLVKSVKKIIDFLPGLPFLRLEIFVKDPLHAGEFVLGKILVSPGMNIFFSLMDGRRVRDTGDTLLSLMTG